MKHRLPMVIGLTSPRRSSNASSKDLNAIRVSLPIDIEPLPPHTNLLDIDMLTLG